jgi:hypothetical protein
MEVTQDHVQWWALVLAMLSLQILLPGSSDMVLALPLLSASLALNHQDF